MKGPTLSTGYIDGVLMAMNVRHLWYAVLALSLL